MLICATCTKKRTNLWARNRNKTQSAVRWRTTWRRNSLLTTRFYTTLASFSKQWEQVSLECSIISCDDVIKVGVAPYEPFHIVDRRASLTSDIEIKKCVRHWSAGKFTQPKLDVKKKKSWSHTMGFKRNSLAKNDFISLPVYCKCSQDKFGAWHFCAGVMSVQYQSKVWTHLPVQWIFFTLMN